MNKVDIVLMGCVYLILGIPLIYMSLQVPEVEDISNLSFNEQDYKTFLDYNPDTTIATEIAPLQRMLCDILKPEFLHAQSSFPEMNRCKDLLKNTQKPNLGDNAHSLNNLRITCLLIGIILCVISFLQFLQLIPQQKSLKSRTKKLTLKYKKKK